ncbi:MAG: hypothetical protein HDS02_09270 [Bacteroides sp.]|nr:hypothetical protein [Bacteroides sp.]
MRKKIMAAAAVAAVGISAYLGFGQKAEPTLTELQLANAEALSNNEYDYSTGKENRFHCGGPVASGSCQFMVVSCEGGGAGCNVRRCPVHG